MSDFIPSEQQKNFFNWVQFEKGSCLLEAVAGAGKTTTLVEALRYMGGKVFFGAYNKKIAEEIRRKTIKVHGEVRQGLYIKTLHAAGMNAWTYRYPKAEINGNKIRTMADGYLSMNEIDTGYADAIVKLVSLGKQFLLGVKRPVDNLCVWRKLAERFSVEFDLPENVKIDAILPHVVAIYRQSHDVCPQVIDFDDMIYAPIAYNLRMLRHDWVLIDERQDTNVARRELAKRLLKTDGRLIAVGDTFQAIYGFTGSTGGTKEFKDDFGCVELPLTVTYRCPKAVVEYVHQWVDHIQAHPDAPEGAVRHINGADAPGKDGKNLLPWFEIEAPAADSAILCRYTKPLIETAYAMLREGRACKVEGRDIGKGLISLATRWKVQTLDALERKLEVYRKKMVAKARASKNERAEQDVNDRIETLLIFVERTRNKGSEKVAALVLEIEALFADDVTGVTTLSTGHKSKGREWSTVYWLQTPHRGKRVLQGWEEEQEKNLKYVMGTRAMNELVLVNLPQ